MDLDKCKRLEIRIAAAELLANVEALQALLPDVFPAVLQEAIAAEQAGYDDAIDRWQPTQA
jgi:hypothetical protein